MGLIKTQNTRILHKSTMMKNMFII